MFWVECMPLYELLARSVAVLCWDCFESMILQSDFWRKRLVEEARRRGGFPARVLPQMARAPVYLPVQEPYEDLGVAR